MSLAGIVAEELLLKCHDVGCSNDLSKAHKISFKLMNISCIDGIDSFCIDETFYDRRNISSYTSKQLDKNTISFMKSNYKIVKKQLKKYKKQISIVADYLQEHREIKRNEFIKIVDA